MVDIADNYQKLCSIMGPAPKKRVFNQGMNAGRKKKFITSLPEKKNDFTFRPLFFKSATTSAKLESKHAKKRQKKDILAQMPENIPRNNPMDGCAGVVSGCSNSKKRMGKKRWVFHIPICNTTFTYPQSNYRKDQRY